MGSDVTNMTLNSGINSLLGHYLGLYEMPKNTKYWRQVHDREGLWGIVKAMYAYSPLLFLTNMLVMPLWLAFLAFVALGVYVMVTDRRLQPAIRAALVVLPVYLALSSQAAISVRWGFRTPFEFILVLLFVAAVWWLLGRRRKETTESNTPPTENPV